MAAVSPSFCEEQFLCCICLEVYTDPCTTERHRDHQTVSLKEEGEEQQATLKLQIKDRRVKVQEIQRSVEQSQRKAEAEKQEGLIVFKALVECVQQRADSFKQSIAEKQQKVKEEASQLIEQIQTEISELEQREAEMEQLWTSGDHLHFVQTFTTVRPAPRLSDWSENTIRTPSYKGTGAQAVSELRNQLNTEIETFFEAELEKVEGKTGWEVGVAKVSVDRKQSVGSQTVQKGYWTLRMDNGDYQTSDDRPVALFLQSRPENVGVFVDRDEGLVSFYDADIASLLHSFTDCGFTENVLPLFNPCGNMYGMNSAPLVLTHIGS
uniref:B30.2/SPRY domain-containing protein n=1 Tax=Knipowitschia caucasica TaxID=637954 RepID=A0AAV2K6W3_KNICA